MAGCKSGLQQVRVRREKKGAEGKKGGEARFLSPIALFFSRRLPLPSPLTFFSRFAYASYI